MPQPAEDGRVGIAMIMPWFPSSSKKVFKISKQHIVNMIEPHTDLINQYNEAFGSGIVVPDKPSGIIEI
jgi:hypothetical protein